MELIMFDVQALGLLSSSQKKSLAENTAMLLFWNASAMHMENVVKKLPFAYEQSPAFIRIKSKFGLSSLNGKLLISQEQINKIEQFAFHAPDSEIASIYGSAEDDIVSKRQSLIQAVEIFKKEFCKTNNSMSEDDITALESFVNSYKGKYETDYAELLQYVKSADLQDQFLFKSLKPEVLGCLKLSLKDKFPQVASKIRQVSFSRFSDPIKNRANEAYQSLKKSIDKLSIPEKKYLWDIVQSTKADPEMFDYIANEIFPEYHQVALLDRLSEEQKNNFLLYIKNYTGDIKGFLRKISRHDSLIFAYDSLLFADDIMWNTRFTKAEVDQLVNLPGLDYEIRNKMLEAVSSQPKARINYVFNMPSFEELQAYKNVVYFKRSGAAKYFADKLPGDLIGHVLSFILPGEKLGTERLLYNKDLSIKTAIGQTNSSVGRYRNGVRSTLAKLSVFFVKNLHEEHFWGFMVSSYIACLLLLFNMASLFWVPLLTFASVFLFSYNVRNNKSFGLAEVKSNINKNFVCFSVSVYLLTLVFMLDILPLAILPIFAMMVSMFSSFPWGSFLSSMFSKLGIGSVDSGLSSDILGRVKFSQSLSFGLLQNDDFKLISNNQLKRISDLLKGYQGSPAVQKFQLIVNGFDFENGELSSVLNQLRALSFEDKKELQEIIGRSEPRLAENIIEKANEGLVAR